MRKEYCAASTQHLAQAEFPLPGGIGARDRGGALQPSRNETGGERIKMPKKSGILKIKKYISFLKKNI